MPEHAVPDREYPEQQKAEAYAKKNWDAVKDDVGPGKTFESEGHKRDYLRRVSSNRFNTPGMPVFLPSEYIQIGQIGTHEARECRTEGCGGCCTAVDYYVCPRCHKDNS